MPSIFPATAESKLKLDFFGDALESIRAFDPETQRTVGTLRSVDLVPMSEVQLITVGSGWRYVVVAFVAAAAGVAAALTLL